MITKLTLKNFKCFEDLELDLKNVNVFTGINGMGKSTVIQAMLLMMQSKIFGEEDKGLHLNGKYVELGNAQDVLYDKAQEEKLTISYTLEDGSTICRNYGFEQDSDVLPALEKTSYKNIFEEEQFVYLSAYRIKPQMFYKVTNEREIKNRNFGNDGEFALQYLNLFGDTDIQNERVAYEGVKERSLMVQTRAWMDRIAPGVSPQVKVLMETRSSELMFDFVEGSTRSNTYKSINVGFGITYVLPIVVALLSAKKGDTVVIENPEAHIHPAGQRMMGELIARVGAGGVQVLVETHSDHIVNGIRIAVKNNVIKSDDACVTYFYKDMENAYRHTFKELKIYDDGKMSSWPKGFLDEWENALIELL